MSYAGQRNRRREQRENTRREILAEADRFLRERSYRDLSVEALMGSTGLTRTAFYRHFDDVSELVLSLLEDVGGELYEIGERWRARAGDEPPIAALEGLNGIVDFFMRNGPLVRSIAHAAATDEQIEQGYRGFLAVFEQLLTDGLDELVRRGQLEVPDTRLMARALNLMNEAFLLAEFGQEPFGDRDLVLQTLATIWLRAVGPVGGFS